MKRTICLNHIIKPEFSTYRERYERGSHGDCRVCQPHTDNIFCCGFKPIEIQDYRVYEPSKPERHEFLFTLEEMREYISNLQLEEEK